MSATFDPSRGAANLLARTAVRSRAPASVTFQVTDRCNYGCVHCYETHGDADELSFAEIDRILGELADEGTLFLVLTGGEFFMRRDAEDILRAARRRRFAVKLLTTGWFVNDARADLIAELGSIQVDMSFYSGDPHVHDHITQIRGSWQRTLDAAERLRLRRVPVVLKSPLMAMNADGIDGVQRVAERLGCHVQLDPKVTTREDGDVGPLRHRPSDEAVRGYYERAYVDGEAPPPKGLDVTPCRAGQDVCGITPQGLVTACHTIPIYGGDLRRQSFREIWRGSPEIQRLRELTWRRIEECNACDLRPYCGRCHAMAYLEDGKLDGPSREACRHAVILRDLLRERGVIPAEHTAVPPPLTRTRVRPSSLRVLE
ncbi:MAG TPA: radical SAM protein [Haliangiales bacterium]|nr:radical SAM protein [Haliangiales bacterium]